MGSKIIWKIENFSCLKDEVLQCPFSSSNYITIIITPLTSTECIGIVLRQYSNICHYSNLAIAFLDSEGTPLLWREVKNIPRIQIYQSYEIKRDTIFGSMRSQFLPNDALRLQFLLWNKREELLNPLSHFCCSRIEHEVIERTFSWDMANKIKQETRDEVELFTNDGVAELVASSGDVLRIQLFLDTSLNVKLSKSLWGKAQRVKCIISALDVNEKLIQFAEIENSNLKMIKMWTFSIPITKDMLMHYQSELLRNNKLTLLFACTFRTNEISTEACQKDDIFVKNSHTKSSSEPANKKLKMSNNTISGALMGILEEGFMSNFSFRVQDKTFPVHKSILGARSSVFRAMFTVDMKEKQGSSVDIQDVDADTFQRMLNFIYSDSFEDGMQWESASKLYAVADKYDVEPLKQKCSQQLKSGMHVSSVLDVLLLGDTHQDDDLKASALDFIAKNDKKIVTTDHWKRFSETNILLAFDALQKLYEKKVCV